MTDYYDPVSAACMEIQETEHDLNAMVLSEEFKIEFERIKLDMGLSAFLLTTKVIKMILLADIRARSKK